MLKRLLLILLLLTASAQAAATDYTDIWFNPAESGWGVNVVQSDAFIFLTFFIYGPDNKPTWYVASVTQDASGNFNGPLYSTNGYGTSFALPWVPPPPPGGTQVGTASFQPTGPSTARLVYMLTSGPILAPVAKVIQRQTLTAITVGGTYSGAQNGAYSSCSISANNAPYTDFFNLQVTQLSNGTVTFAFTYEAFNCTFSGTLVQQGQLYSVPGASYQCASDPTFSANLTEIKATAQGIEGKFSALVGGNCREDAHFSAVLQ